MGDKAHRTETNMSEAQRELGWQYQESILTSEQVFAGLWRERDLDVHQRYEILRVLATWLSEAVPECVVGREYTVGMAIHEAHPKYAELQELFRFLVLACEWQEVVFFTRLAAFQFNVTLSAFILIPEFQAFAQRYAPYIKGAA